MYCRAYQDSGSVGPTSNPNMELDLKRIGLPLRTTGSTFGAAGSGRGGGTGNGAVDAAGGASDGVGSGGGAGSGFFAASAATTRLVISSTMVPIAASSATVTAARTCSSSTTVMNGATVALPPAGPAGFGASDVCASRSAAAASASGFTDPSRTVASNGFISTASDSTCLERSWSSVSSTPAVRITRTWRCRGLILTYWQMS